MRKTVYGSLVAALAAGLCVAVIAVGEVIQLKQGTVKAVPAEAGEKTGPEDTAGTHGWLTDFEAAKAAAAKRGVPILIDFSGSDWCGWCIRLDKEVFKQDAFRDFASESVVLFLADFPRRSKLPAEQRKQNEQLMRKYGVRGFPTVLLVDKTGKELARTGYRRGGPEAYVEHLRELIGGNKD
jgi:thiol:disulfide interchange protein